MLVHHVRDESGALCYDDGRPVTITVTATWAPRTRLPDGPVVPLPDAAPASEAAIERVCDRVLTWTYREGGRPLPCSRNAVRALCRTAPHTLAEIQRAITIASRLT